MKQETTRNNLAKLLATEDISVEHKNMPTAYFDVQNRVLGLPIWKDASKDVYDLLVGHEVGHALFTPTTNFVDLAKDIDPDNVMAVKSFINVIEDARIEKKIKRKFPGLRKNFYRGYEELVEKNFFGTEGRDFDSYSLIDKINLYFKIGSHIDYSFTPEEKAIVDEIDNAETFDSVLEIVKKIYKHELEESSDTTFDNSEENSEESEESEGSEEFNNSKEGSEESENEESEEQLEESETLENFNESMKDIATKTTTDYVYAKIPSVSAEEFIIDYKICNKQVSKYIAGKDLQAEIQNFKYFKKSITKTVNYLAKGFEMKKSASEYAKANIAKTGVIDTNKIHSYKFNDDLFRRVTSIPQGKNHGLLMFIDWSGSMAGSIFDTIKQTITLAMFCKKVNIPFEIYTFTDANIDNERDYTLSYKKDDMIFSSFNLRNYLSSRMNSKEFDQALWNIYYIALTYEHGYWGTCDPLGSTPLNDALLATFDIYEKFKGANRLEKVNVIYLTDGASNGNTVIYDPNTVYGYNTIQTNWWGKASTFIVDPVTKISIGIKKTNNITNALLKHLENRYGANVLGFFIVDSIGSGELAQQIDPDGDKPYGHLAEFGKKLRKEKSVTILDHSGYTELYVICGGKNLKVEADGLDGVAANATRRVLTTAFKKNQRSKVSNKVILDNFIEAIS